MINRQLLGMWKLVHSVEIDAAKNQHYPFGVDAIGYIVYDAAGKMAVQISRAARQAFHSKVFKGATATEALTLSQDYLAYFGGYEVDVESQVVHHRIEGSLFPNYIGQTLSRRYHFYDDFLSLKPIDGTDREILWQKIPS